MRVKMRRKKSHEWCSKLAMGELSLLLETMGSEGIEEREAEEG